MVSIQYRLYANNRFIQSASTHAQISFCHAVFFFEYAFKIYIKVNEIDFLTPKEIKTFTDSVQVQRKLHVVCYTNVVHGAVSMK